MKLTEQQIENWRKSLVTTLGPYALMMPKADILAHAQKVQNAIDDITEDEYQHEG